MFSFLTKPFMTGLAWAALALGLSVGSVSGYKLGSYMGDNTGYARALSEVRFKAEKEVADALEDINRDRRNRVNDGVPLDGTDPNDRR